MKSKIAIIILATLSIILVASLYYLIKNDGHYNAISNAEVTNHEQMVSVEPLIQGNPPAVTQAPNVSNDVSLMPEPQTDGPTIAELESKLILTELENQYPLTDNEYVLPDLTDGTRFFITLSTTPAKLFAYDASLDTEWSKHLTVDVTNSDTVFSYVDPQTTQSGDLLQPLKVEDGKVIFGEIAPDWSANNCQSTFLAFKNQLYSIDLSSTGKAVAQKYVPSSLDLTDAESQQIQCTEANNF